MFQTHLQSGPVSSIKQNKPKAIYQKEFMNKESIPVQNKTRKMPRNYAELPRGTNNHPSNSDILNEIHKTQTSLQGGLSTAKGLSAHLKVMAGRNSKKVRFYKSGLESGKPSKMKGTKRQCSSAQISNGMNSTFPTHSIRVSEGVSQILANDQIVAVTNDADIPNLSPNSEHSYVGTHIPSDVDVCTNQLPKSESQNAHLQAGVKSQVKRRQSKLVSAGSETSRNVETGVLKSSQADNISSHHTNVCNCGTSKVPTDPCNSAVIHLKDSFPSEENTGDRDPQLGTKLVVQSLPSLTIKRNLSVQKAPSVSIPPPDAPPYASPRHNVGLCKMSHGGILLDICDCTSESCDHKKRTDKNVSKAEPKLLEGTRRHAHQKHGRYKGSHASSGLDKRDRAAKERTHEGLGSQTVPAVSSKCGKCNECEGYFLTNEMKGELCNTCYNKSHKVLKLQAEIESHKTKPHRRLSGSPMKQQSTEQYQFVCKRCGNNFLLRDLYYGVCGECCNIPSSVHDANQLMHGSAADAVKAAAHLSQCSACFRHFPQSELFYGHCIHCQIVKKEMRLSQCNICLNSVLSTEYNNGTCNQCRDKLKSDTQKDELYAYPANQGPAKERMLNTLLYDGTPIFFDISKAQHLNKSPPTGENRSIQNKKGNCSLSEADKKRQKCNAQGTTVKTAGLNLHDTTRKNRGRHSKVHFEREERLNYNENEPIEEPLELPRENEKRAERLQEAQTEKLESGDYHKHCAMIRTYDKPRTTLHFGAPSCDRAVTCSDSSGCSHMEDQAAYDSVNNDDGGYEQDIESGNRSTDTEVEVSKDNEVYSRMYPSAPQTVKCDSKLKDSQLYVHEVAAVQRAAANLLEEDPKWVHAVYQSSARIVSPAQHRQLSTSNRGETDPAERSRPFSKILAPGDETDQSSSRSYSDNYDDTSESVSDTRVKIGSRDKSLNHGSIFRSGPDKSRQHNKYLFGDHSESVQAADKPKYSSSKSKESVTDIEKVASSHFNWQHGTESHSDTAVDDTTRYSAREYLKHCLDGNCIRRKPLQTEEVACTNKQKHSPGTAAVAKKPFGCRMNSEEDDDEEKDCEVSMTR
jgi:hypothetical protein